MRILGRKSQKGPKRRRIRKLRLLAILAVLGVFSIVSFAYGVVYAVGTKVPACDPTRANKKVLRDGYIYANDDKTVLAVLRGSESRVLVGYDQISDFMKQAIVAVEDKRFFEHRGIDVHGIVRAAWADVTHQKVVQGASTITEQFVKNTCGRSEHSIARKLTEALLAVQLEQKWSKEKILTAYLNRIYFGNGAYGVQRAAYAYFGHSARKLTLPEAALLAGIPADPTLYDPIANPRAARARRNLVLRDMLEQNKVTPEQFAHALKAPLPKDVQLPSAIGQAQYFTNYVKQQLIDSPRYGAQKVFGGGLHVETSIDLNVQQLAREAISQVLPDPKGPSAALVAIDPRTGSVLAMIGGRSFRKSQFNLAVQGERQPGSSFKPFVLATALRQGISPDTTFESKPVTIPYDDRLWAVHNYEGSYLGTIDLTTATIVSDNAVYAQLTRLVEPANVAKMAGDLGIQSPLDNFLAIGLGGEAVNPLEMARAFSTFANGGERIDGSLLGDRPRAILSVTDLSGLKKNAPVPHRPTDFSSNDAAIVNSILQRVVTEGTGQRAQLADGRPVAGKTGTTENYGDAWFVGYTPQLAAAVWVGYPDSLRPMTTEFEGSPVAGGTFPALIWKTFMEKALPYLHDDPESFAPPEYPGDETERLALRNDHYALDNTGYCRETIDVAYFSGSRPARNANCKRNEVEVPKIIGLSLPRAIERLRRQPLTPKLVYAPAVGGQRLDIVKRQFPSPNETLSSFDDVLVGLPKALHGVVPHLVGLTARDAIERVRALHMEPHVSGGDSTKINSFRTRVVRQLPPAGRAAAPGLGVTLFVTNG
jgi:penicillin-binding protein 1A